MCVLINIYVDVDVDVDVDVYIYMRGLASSLIVVSVGVVPESFTRH